MLATARHLVLSGFQEIKYRGIGRIFRIGGECLHQHGHRMLQTFVGSAIIDGAEQHLLLTSELSQQIAVGSSKEGALVNAILLAEGIHLCCVNVHHPCQQSFLALFFLTVRQQW